MVMVKTKLQALFCRLNLPFKDNYVANLTFEATDVFNADTAQTTFNVTAVDPDFSISIDNVVAGNPVSVAVSANEAFSGVVTVKVNGIDVLVSVKDGNGKNETTGVVLPFKLTLQSARLQTLKRAIL